MRNLLALAAAALIVFVVVGWFLDWYHVTSRVTATGREYDVNFNSPKISADLHRGEAKVEEMVKKKLDDKGSAVPQQQGSPAQQPPAAFEAASDGSAVPPPSGARPTPSDRPMPR